MGSGYANVVERCLTGNFDCLKQGRKAGNDIRAKLAFEFHEKVVVPLQLRAVMERTE